MDVATPDQVERTLKEQLAKLPVDSLSPQAVSQLQGLATTLQLFLQGRNDILDKMAKGTLLTFEYTNKRNVNAPDTSNFRLIYETGPTEKLDVTANASLTMFNSKPTDPGVSRVRDFQFAGQADFPFGDVTKTGRFVLSFAGRYERLMENASTEAGMQMAGTKGDIGIGQIKLMIPLRAFGLNGMKLPVSLTFSNRTELIKEREVRGNIGFTFDFDAALAKILGQ
jgi:hypothetical protein